MRTSSLPKPVLSAGSIASIINMVRPPLLSTLCLASLGIGAVSLVAPRTFAAPPPVTVAQPVQVQVVNSEPLAVKGTVAVSGPLNVSLTGNSSDTPVFVQAARQPLFRASALFNWSENAGAQLKITNTTGARVAIQYLHTSGQIVKAYVFKWVDVSIQGPTFNSDVARLKPTYDGVDFFPTYNQYSASMQVNLNLEPGESLIFTGYLSGVGGYGVVTVSGLVLD